MSQPKHQLETFKSWAGKGGSDISYYLNSHHIDFHEWCMHESSRPISVTAVASSGVAVQKLGVPCEDTITLTVQWENLDQTGDFLIFNLKMYFHFLLGQGSIHLGQGTAVYTSSWIAPKSDVHSQQRFFYMGQVCCVIFLSDIILTLFIERRSNCRSSSQGL